MKKIKNFIEKFPKKLIKRLFGIFAVCGLSLAIFSPNVCRAADNNAASALEQQETFSQNLRSVINMVSQIVYIFIWPLLVIAWTALDNTLVYGKFLNLDAALWDIWNIMKNIANFALWFVFVFAIVKNLFKSSFWDWNPMQDAVKVVKGTLISGVLVQMSWFILGTLIDLSTILIYAVWGLPLSMLWSYNADAANVPIMELHANLDESDWSFFHYYSYGWYNFSPCFVIDNDDKNSNIKLEGNHKWKYIAWRKYLYLSGDIEFTSWYCALDWYPYKYIESAEFFCTGSTWCYEKAGNTLAAMNADYNTKLSTYIKKLTWESLEAQKQNCFIISAYGTWCELSSDTWTHYWAISFTWDIFSSVQWKMDSLLESSKWRVWPLITMYSSILKVQELIVNPWSTSTMSTLFWALINTLFVLVLFIPIAILAILLIIRIWFLWVVIAISPILILINFGPDPINKLKNNEIFKKFDMKEIFRQIFSPIVVAFAVSLSIIFLTTIRSLKPESQDNQFLNSLWIEQHDCEWHWSETDGSWGVSGNSPENCRYLVSWLVDLKINLSGFNHWKDVFVRCLMMMLSVGIVRFFMKFAISMMWEKWKELFKTAEKLVTNYPIIPLWKTWGKVWIWAFGIWEWNSGRLSSLTDEKINTIVNMNEQKEVLGRLFGPNKDKDEDEGTDKQVNTILNEVRAGKSYSDLSSQQKEIMANYYGDADVAQSVVNNVYNYTQNVDGVKNTITDGISDEMKNWTHTSADALKLTADQLNIAVQNDSTWKAWAGSMIWWAVHTNDWVRIVDVVKWTETTNPVYRIVERDEYERSHFGDKTIESVDKNDYDKNKSEIDKYLEQLQKKLTELEELQAKKDRSEQDNNKLKSLESLDITQEQLDKIKETLWIS